MAKVVMLVGDTDTSRIVYNAIKNDFEVTAIIQEQPESTLKFIKRRIKRLGLIKVVGQIAFILINKLLKQNSNERIQEITDSYSLDATEYPENILSKVESVNSKSVVRQLKQLNPDVIVVNGTRIISSKVLNSVKIPFINTHTGITPKYRGVHGGYWALTQQDFDRCGVTIHLVDEGIDTGSILYQETIKPSKEDNFNTYPYLQYGRAINLIKKAIDDIFQNQIKIEKNKLDSKLWFHPTIFEYLKYRFLLNVK